MLYYKGYYCDFLINSVIIKREYRFWSSVISRGRHRTDTRTAKRPLGEEISLNIAIANLFSHIFICV